MRIEINSRIAVVFLLVVAASARWALGETVVDPGDEGQTPFAVNSRVLVMRCATDEVAIFEREGRNWTLTDCLAVPLPIADASPPIALVSNDEFLLGDPGQEVVEGRFGLVYAFYREEGGAWQYRQPILPPVPPQGNRFGETIAVRDGVAYVGAPGIPPFETDGVVFVYRQLGSGPWIPSGRIEAPEGLEDSFGRSISVSDDRLLIGADREVVVYERVAPEPDGWAVREVLTGFGEGVPFSFGRPMVLENGLLAVGAPDEFSGAARSGRVYVFERDAGGSFQPVQVLAPTEPEVDSRFGHAIDLDGDSLWIARRSIVPSVTRFDRGKGGLFDAVGDVRLASHDPATSPDEVDGIRVIAGIPVWGDHDRVVIVDRVELDVPWFEITTIDDAGIEGVASDDGANDSGIALIELVAGSSNAVLEIEPFAPGADEVDLTILPIDSGRSDGILRIVDVAGNVTFSPFDFGKDTILSFAVPVSIPLDQFEKPEGFAVGDLDDDGHDDLVGADAGVRVWFGDRTGLGSDLRLGGAAQSVAVADYDGDGRLDIVASNRRDGKVAIQFFRNAGDRTFELLRETPPPNSNATFKAMRAVHVDVDGDADLFAYDAVDMHLLHGDGTGGFVLAESSEFGVRDSGVGDFDSDGIDDPCVASSDEVALWLSGAEDPWELRRFQIDGSLVTDVVVGDFTGDGHVDAAYRREPGASIRFLAGDGAGNLSPAGGVDLSEVYPNPFGFSMQAVDPDRDGDLDLLVAVGYGDSILLRSDGAGGFQRGPVFLET